MSGETSRPANLPGSYQPPQTPLIRDTNGNGALDGKDILDQLRAEEVGDEEHRVASEVVHGLMEQMGIYDMMNGMIEQKRIHMPMLAATFSADIKMTVERINQVVAKDPEKFMQDIEDAVANAKIPEERRAMTLQDNKNLIYFAIDFEKTFPGGVNITGKDLVDLVGHYGMELAPVPTPPSVKPQERRQESDSIIASR